MPGLADQLALARRLDLEDAERAGLADHRVGRLVVERHLRLVVEVDLDVVDPLDLDHRVRHRGLHPDAEHVELEQAEVLDVVLVELTHREAGEARLDRGAVEQGRVGEQHPARVHGDVPGQPVEPLDQPEQQVEPFLAEAAGPQLGQLAQGHPGVAGADVRERLGDRVGLAGRHAESGADVADGVADPVGVHHRDADAALAAVLVEDRLVDLEPPRGLDVDVDVGQRLAQRGEEPLHQQAVPDRVDPGDTEQVVDQAARPRPPGRAPHPHLLDEVGDVADGEEVGRVAEAADDLQLVVEALPDALAGSGAVARADRRLAAGPERAVGRGPAEPLTSKPLTSELLTSNSGKCTSPSPRSARGSRAHRSATRRVAATSRSASSTVSLDNPASRQISSATSCICLPDLRKPSALPRSRCAASRARRAAGRSRGRRRWARRDGRRSGPRWSAPSRARPVGRPRPSGRRGRRCRAPSRRRCPAAGGRPARRAGSRAARGHARGRGRPAPGRHDAGSPPCRPPSPGRAAPPGHLRRGAARPRPPAGRGRAPGCPARRTAGPLTPTGTARPSRPAHRPGHPRARAR